MLAKLSSSSTIADASRATSVPTLPIATPMSALFSAGASFTPSPVIATNSPRRLQRLDDADLLLGIDARVDAQMPHARSPAPRRSRRASSRPVIRRSSAVVDDAEPHGDRARGERMVAGDHHGRHARLPALGHGARRLGARRIDQADEADEGKFPFYNRRGQLAG